MTPPSSLDGFVALALLRLRLRPLTTGRLLHRHRDPRRVLPASSRVLRSLGPLAPREREALGGFRDWEAVRRERERAREAGVDLVAFDDARYPAALRELPDPPALLYLRGDLAAASRHPVAIVGSRRASAYGLAVARAFGTHLGRAGVTVVSGFARGIDGAAHEGALDGGGATVAVLGCGIDVLYPAVHRRLRERIVPTGALVSELPLGTRPHAAFFPERNRIVSGLARAVLVVEAGARSGTSITARAALEQGRDVYAVPGPIDAPGSVGPHSLIRCGAMLASEPDQVLAELGLPTAAERAAASPGADHAPPRSAPRGAADSTPRARVLAALGTRPLDAEALRERTRLDPAALAAALLELELAGQARREPTGGYTATDPFRSEPSG